MSFLEYFSRELMILLFLELNFIDGWNLARTCKRLSSDFMFGHIHYPDKINPICSDCKISAIESRQQYHIYYQQMIEYLDKLPEIRNSILPMVCNQSKLCPCQYNRAYTINEIFPKMDDNYFIFSLSSKTRFSFEIKRGDGLVIAFRYTEPIGRTCHSLLHLERDENLQIYVQDINILSLHDPCLILETPSKKLEEYIRTVLKYCKPFNLSTLDNYSLYLSGNYSV